MSNRKFEDIIGRVEEVRKQLGLNKSQFSTRMGLKPQTYNNFIGVQNSKPNVALILGLVEAFNVDPQWLLNGAGSAFRDRVTRGPSLEPGEIPGRATQSAGYVPSRNEITSLRVELEMLLGPFRGGAMPTLHREVLHHTEVQMAIQMLTHLFRVAPVETTAQVVQMLDDFQRIAGEMELARRTEAHNSLET